MAPRNMTMGTRSQEKNPPTNIAFEEQTKILSYRRCGEKIVRKRFVVFFFFFLTAAGGAICFFLVANCQHAKKNQLVRR